MIALKLRNIGKCFGVSDKREGSAQKFLSKIRLSNNKFWALKNISFDVKKGECIGIIGDNGSGKSTLLKILAGITTPSEGKVEINGEVGSFLELGVGFQGELSGKENILFYSSLLGLEKKEIESIYSQILGFSELGGMIDQPIRTYSSGMLARLAFSVLSFTNPEIILLDEVISVGDYSFKQKSLNKLLDFKRKGKTILLVSHNILDLPNICDKCLLLEQGRIKLFDNAQKVTEYYMEESNIKNKLNLLTKIKKEELKSDNEGNLLYFYNELNIILDNMIELKKSIILTKTYKQNMKDDYQALITLYVEKIGLMKKMLFYYTKGGLKTSYVLFLYEDLINSIYQLKEVYKDTSEGITSNKYEEICREEIKLLKEVIPLTVQLENNSKMLNFCNALTQQIIDCSNIDKDEKKLVLLDLKETLKENLKHGKNSKEILTLLVRIIQELASILKEKEMIEMLDELKGHMQNYTQFSDSNKMRTIMQQIIKEQIKSTNNPNKKIAILNRLKESIKEQIKEEKALFLIMNDRDEYSKKEEETKKIFGFTKMVYNLLHEKLINDIMYIESFKEITSMIDTQTDNNKRLDELIKDKTRAFKKLEIAIKKIDNTGELINLKSEYNRLLNLIK